MHEKHLGMHSVYHMAREKGIGPDILRACGYGMSENVAFLWQGRHRLQCRQFECLAVINFKQLLCCVISTIPEALCYGLLLLRPGKEDFAQVVVTDDQFASLPTVQPRCTAQQSRRQRVSRLCQSAFEQVCSLACLAHKNTRGQSRPRSCSHRLALAFFHSPQQRAHDLSSPGL